MKFLMNIMRFMLRGIVAIVVTACSSRPDNDMGNVVFNFDEKLVPLQYSFFPDHSYSGSVKGNFNNSNNYHGSGGGNINFGNMSGEGAAVFMAVVMGVFIVIYTVGVIAHQMDSTEYYMEYTNGELCRQIPIIAGLNHLSFNEYEIDSINSGKAFIIIRAVGKYTGVKLASCEIKNNEFIIRDAFYVK